jgi:hypothetical protein
MYQCIYMYIYLYVYLHVHIYVYIYLSFSPGTYEHNKIESNYYIYVSIYIWINVSMLAYINVMIYIPKQNHCSIGRIISNLNHVCMY